ncbi:hypothetical protein ABN080_14265 [Proteus sp. fly-1089]|uniref:hypothetical protein n=1 Tax=Proteus sp. fly-1089 TaxID=3136675 RepID=UPI0032D9B717
MRALESTTQSIKNDLNNITLFNATRKLSEIQSKIVQLRNTAISDNRTMCIEDIETAKFLYHIEVNKNEHANIEQGYNKNFINSDCVNLMLKLYNKTISKIPNKEENIKHYKNILKHNENLTSIKKNINTNKELIKESINIISQRFKELVNQAHNLSDKDHTTKEYQNKLNDILYYINSYNIDKSLNGKNIIGSTENIISTKDITNYHKNLISIKNTIIEIIKKYKTTDFILSNIKYPTNNPIIFDKIEEHLSLINKIHNNIRKYL